MVALITHLLNQIMLISRISSLSTPHHNSTKCPSDLHFSRIPMFPRPIAQTSSSALTKMQDSQLLKYTINPMPPENNRLLSPNSSGFLYKDMASSLSTSSNSGEYLKCLRTFSLSQQPKLFMSNLKEILT
jgi:hypothetical protein